ncbi:MAG: nucleoside hydrolase [Planctomycetota bacterium]|nr:nucleoside hydrolase [Planctomycetota bacterium]
MRPILNTLGSLLFALPVVAAEGPAAAAPVPVILDTDIGDDIDDSWALTMLLKSPQFDLKLVTTTCGKAEYRAKIVARLLTVAKRTDVAVGLGAGGRNGDGGQQPWVKDYKLADYPGKVHDDGVKALIDLVNSSPQPVTIIAIGPVHTLAAALERDPGIAAKANFAGMHGSVRKGYGGGAKPDAEYNVKNNVPAAKKVLGAPWRQCVITPLDTCGLVTLAGARFKTLCASDDELVKALLDNYRMWAKKAELSQLTASSVLFDTVAVYLADPAPKPLIELESLNIAVNDGGFTVIDPAGAKMSVATNWKDLDGYKDHLVKVLLAPTVKK